MRLADLRLELVFVNRNSQTGVGQQGAVPIANRRQRFCQKIRMLCVAIFLNEEIGDRRGNLITRSERTWPLRIVWREG